MKAINKPAIAVLLCFGLAGLIQAAEPVLREGAPSRYEVQRGDTLWDIAGQFLESPWLWPQIWGGNPQIQDPNLIYPGDVILLSIIDGEPVLRLETPQFQTRAVTPSPQPQAAVRDNIDDTALPVVRRSPEIRREPRSGPIPVIALDDIDTYLSSNRVVALGELERAPVLLESRPRNLLASRGDEVFAKGTWQPGITGYEIMRPSRDYRNPGSRRVIGKEAILVGNATLVDVDGELGTLRVNGTRMEIRPGDRFIPREATVIDSRYFPEPPAFEVEGGILDINSGKMAGGKFDSLVINLGSDANLKVGHVLALQKPDRMVRDGNSRRQLRFDGEKYAQVLIYRVSALTSQALVLSADQPVRLDDRVVTP